MTTQSRSSQPTSPIADRRERYWPKLATAMLTLVFTVLVLVLPPIANAQLASAERTMEKPLIAVLVALAGLLVGAWLGRLALCLVALLVMVAALQGGYYVYTIQPGRDAARTAQAWQAVPLGHGFAKNHPGVFGSATMWWSGDRADLSLRSNTGTTQQGIWLHGGSPSSSFYFSARTDKKEGGNAVFCPLLFGIASTRSYFTFRIQQLPNGTNEAVAYQIIPNSPSLTSGFHGLLLDQDTDIPYVGDWNILTPSYRTHTTLAIEAHGNYYQFFIDNREVFSRVVNDVPTHNVAVGVTVLANGSRSAAVCEYDQVSLRVHPAGS